MPIDMPIEKLREYKGTNPCPKDFDEYWKTALEEMNGLDPRVEIKKSEFQVPNSVCYDMRFTGTRGGSVYVKLLKPAVIKGKAPALLRFHGYGEKSGDWGAYLSYVSMGFVVAAMDCRGQGGRSDDKNPVRGNTHHGLIIRGIDEPDPHNLYFRNVFLDTALLAKIVADMEDVDEDRVAAYGGSQGGGLAMACAALAPNIIKKASVLCPFLSDYKRVWDLNITMPAYSELKEYFLLFDPRHEREEETFTKLGYIDIQNFADRIRGDVLFGTGLMDNICPPSSVFAAYNKIVSEKQIFIYPDCGHGNLPDFEDMTLRFIAELI